MAMIIGSSTVWSCIVQDFLLFCQSLRRICGGGVRVLRLTNSYGHTETGPRFKVSSERLEKPGIELTTPGLKGE